MAIVDPNQYVTAEPMTLNQSIRNHRDPFDKSVPGTGEATHRYGVSVVEFYKTISRDLPFELVSAVVVEAVKAGRI